MSCCFTVKLFGQHAYGTTGLLFAPTAEMQKDKTVMIGGGMLDRNTYRDGYWNSHEEYNPYTYNYYLNITIFPWLEVAYTCTLVKGVPGWPQQTLGKFVNQDRSFHGRLRLWKEGWWKQSTGTGCPGIRCWISPPFQFDPPFSNPPVTIVVLFQMFRF